MFDFAVVVRYCNLFEILAKPPNPSNLLKLAGHTIIGVSAYGEGVVFTQGEAMLKIDCRRGGFCMKGLHAYKPPGN